MSLPQNSQNLSLDTKRHSFAHLMAAAVKQMFPETQFGVGPVIENGCYYDFILPRTLIPEDLPLIENKIKEMLKQHLAFKVQEISLEDAIIHFQDQNQPLKVELLNDLRTKGTTSMSEEEREGFGENNKNLVYRIICKNDYDEIKNQSEYSPEEIQKDGFIHLSKYEQIVKVANLKMNPNQENLLLAIDIDKLKDINSLKNEDLYNSGEDYPHLYGSLNMDSVVRVGELNYDKINNTFVILQATPTITLYRLVNESTGEILFEDLCKGPHVGHVKEMKQLGFALDKFSASYWRGDQERDIRMQRLYALVFETVEERLSFQTQREEAKKRDHKILGRQLEWFFFDETAPGMPYFLPKGLTIKNKLIEFWRQDHFKRGYTEYSSPLISKQTLFETSGHWEHYRDDMMITKSKGEDVEWGIKAMSCPNACTIYKIKPRSYKDLPLRLSDLDTLHRNENPGSLNGLFRVRVFNQDDSHNFIRPDQVEMEMANIIDIVYDFYKLFGMENKVKLYLSTMPDEHLGEEETWRKAESVIENVLNKSKFEFGIKDKDGAFYGPKIDIHLTDALGRDWQCGTIQLDYQLPERFDLWYTDESGEKQRPVIIHRVIYGSLDRFIGILIEHTAGRLPFWLAPTQVKILTINTQPETLEYVEKVKEILNETVLMKPLKYNELRFEVDDRSESLGKKIREGEMQKIPVLIIVGPKDVAANTVSLRTQEGESKVGLGELGEFFVNYKEI